MTFPFVAWLGRNPLSKHGRLFRLVHRGPARPNRPDDVPFSVEQRVGLSMMKQTNWAVPATAEARLEAIHAISHAFGQVLMADPGSLVAGHPINCELNMAIIEGREAKGCDCNGPADPMIRADE